MAAFATLLRRFNERASVMDERLQLKAFREKDEPARQKAWRAWTHAQKALARKSPHLCLTWLAETKAASDGDEVLRAEVSTAEAASWRWLDEPRQVIGPARSAWDSWLKLASAPDKTTACSSARILLGILSEPDPSPALSDEEIYLAWLQDRLAREFDQSALTLVSLYGDFRDADGAKQVSSAFVEWVDRYVRVRFGDMSDVVIAKHLLALGDVYDRCGRSADALSTFQQALTKIERAPALAEIVHIRAELNFNAANQLARLGHNGEALELFELARRGLLESEDKEAMLRAWYAVVFTKYAMREDADIDDLIDLAEAYESVLESAGSGSAQMNAWQMVNKVYRLLIRLYVKTLDTNDALRTTMLFHQLLALKEHEAKLTRMWRVVQRNPDTTIQSEISVMLDRLDQRSDASLLIIESVHDALIVVSLGVGADSWNSRVTVQVVERDKIAAAERLIHAQHQAVDDLVNGVIERDSAADTAFLEACTGAWAMFDEGVRRSIESAETVFVIIDNQTDLDLLPVELLHDGQTFIGLRKNVVRVPSLTELNLVLGDNRTNSAPTKAALIVRAEDPLPVADLEVSTVRARLEDLEITVNTMRGPTPADVVSTLGAGIDVFHYVGHGLADQIGEELPLGPGGSLRALDLDASQPAPAPATMLSGCLTGRGRQLRTGHLQGFVPALLRNGSPAVLAAKYLVGEEFVPEFADLVYESWKDNTLGTAVREARQTLAQDGYHPAVWCSYVVFGVPEARAGAPHAREAHTWPAAAMRFLATGSDGHLTRTLELLASDQRLPERSRAAVARDLAALAAGTPDYFDEGRLTTDHGLDAFPEALMASNLICAFGLLRHGTTGKDRSSLFGHILTMQQILGDSYLLVATAAEMKKRTILYLEREGQALRRRAGRRLRWVSADEHNLTAVTSIL